MAHNLKTNNIKVEVFDENMQPVEVITEIMSETRIKITSEQDLSTRLDLARREQMYLLSDAGRLANRQEEIVRRLASAAERQMRTQREVQAQQDELTALDHLLA